MVDELHRIHVDPSKCACLYPLYLAKTVVELVGILRGMNMGTMLTGTFLIWILYTTDVPVY